MSSNTVSRFLASLLPAAGTGSSGGGFQFGLNANNAPAPQTVATTCYTLGSLFFRYSPLIAPVLIWVMDAPHGRFAPKSATSWTVHGNYGWLLMEVVSPLTFIASLLTSSPLLGRTSWKTLLLPQWAHFLSLPLPNRILASLFVIHYIHRAIISPLTSPTRSRMHISVPISAIGFNLVNGFLMGSWLGGHSPSILSAADAVKLAVRANAQSASTASFWRSKKSKPSSAPVGIQSLALGPGLIPASALRHPLFWIAIAGWAIGFTGNIYHDELLANLRRKPRTQPERAARKAAETNGVRSRYKVPYGGLFEYISFPNYLCEWFEWASFAFAALYFLPLFQAPTTTASLSAKLATVLQAPPALFLLAEVSTMLPRAYKGHQWYKTTFGAEFPKERKAVIPFVF